MVSGRFFVGVLGGMLGSVSLLSIGLAATSPKPPSNICLNGVCTAATDIPAVAAKSAQSFVDSIGVNTHFNQTSTPYVTQYALVKQKLLQLGITHARDGAMDSRGIFPTKDQAATYRDLGASGIRFTFIFNPNVSKEFVQGYPDHVAPAFEAYEFPNEYNAKTDWVNTLRNWAPTFSSYVRSNPSTASYPIIGPSLIDFGDNPYGALGDLSAYMDNGNIHSYYSSRHPGTTGYGGAGAAPCDPWRYGALTYKTCNAQRTSGDKAIMSTETGWGSDVTQKAQIPAATQAKYLARMLMLHFDAGIARTHIYQLIDAGADSFTAYGLLTVTGEEKPAYKELKSLISTLRDTGEVTSPGTLPFALIGDVTDVRSVLLQKSDGTFRLVLWLEKSGFDPFTTTPVTVEPRNITLRLDSIGRVKSATAYQDDGAAVTTVPSRTAAADYALTLTDNLTVLKLTH